MKNCRGNKTLYARYDDDGLIMAVADSKSELAEMLHISIPAVCHSLQRGSKKYAEIKFGEDEDDRNDTETDSRDIR